jgi:hypothetical protein
VTKECPAEAAPATGRAIIRDRAAVLIALENVILKGPFGLKLKSFWVDDSILVLRKH